MSLLGPTLLDPPRGDDGKPQGPPPITWKLGCGLLAAVLGSFISNLDTRLTTFSLADLRGGIGYGQDEASWVTVAYDIGEIAVVPMTPWLASIISPRLALTLFATLLTVAGALVPAAGDLGFTWVVGARFVQGLGGGALIPLLLTILLRFLPLHQRVYGFAIYAMLTASTPLISESLAGVLTDIYSWKAVFYVGAALGPAVIVLALYGLPVEPAKPEMFATTDYAGMFLLAASTSLVTTALLQGQRLDWFSSDLIDVLFTLGGLLFAGFLAVELMIEKPLIDLSLLLRRNFSGGLITIVAFSFSTLMTSSVLPSFGMEVRGFRELQVGQILIWAALAQVVVCCLGPALVHRFEARVLLGFGLCIATIGARLATFIDSDWVLSDILPSHLLQACGQPLIMLPLLLISTGTLQPKDAIAGSTVFNVVRTLAGTLGGAVIGAILTVRERVHSNTIADHLVAGAPSTVHAQSLGSIAAEATRQATVMASADAYGWIGMATLSIMLLAVFLHESKLTRAPERAP